MKKAPSPTVLVLALTCFYLADGSVAEGGAERATISGELKEWHKVTLTLQGPFARELDTDPNPFTDYRMTVSFTHESGSPSYLVPGYFAADGDTANTSATEGNRWRAHVSPDKAGTWSYEIRFVKGKLVAVDSGGGEAVKPYDGLRGTFVVRPTDKTGRDLRARGRLQYVGGHHLRFAASGEYFLKAGPDAPETFLACVDVDGTRAHRPGRRARPGEAAPTGPKTWRPHVHDWREGDPTWKAGKGKGMIGALNYIASKGCNAFSFLLYNAGGDGDNVWPFIERDDKLHYDCSKLDQWGTVFDHATSRGLFLHFKLQETEIDDNRTGPKKEGERVKEALDGGKLGPERKLYLRELIARYGHHLALNWNLGEENTQSPAEQRAMAAFIRDTDPYDHLIVVHTYPNQQDKVYPPLLGDSSTLTGASLQNRWDAAHRRTLKWLRASREAGKPWVVCNDEQNPASLGVPPDPGYAGFSGNAMEKGGRSYNLHDIRKYTLWGTLLAGGGGVEYYFGYQLPQNDLACEDWRSRDRSWDYCRIALDFFRDEKIPFWLMSNADELVGNPDHSNTCYCFAKPDEIYLVYLPEGGTAEIDLSATSGIYSIEWFNPREGGDLLYGEVRQVRAGRTASTGQPPSARDRDWLVVIRRKRA